jgi:hypothetical protein
MSWNNYLNPDADFNCLSNARANYFDMNFELYCSKVHKIANFFLVISSPTWWHL